MDIHSFTATANCCALGHFQSASDAQPAASSQQRLWRRTKHIFRRQNAGDGEQSRGASRPLERRVSRRCVVCFATGGARQPRLDDAAASEGRAKALSGDFVCDEEALEAWTTPSAVVAGLASSAFADSRVERDAPLDEPLPEPRRLGGERGAEARLADARRGAKDESTSRRATWEERARELESRLKSSAGVIS